MRDHTQPEVYRTATLVTDALVNLLNDLRPRITQPEVRASKIMNENMDVLIQILNMPHGGALSPDELAEMVLSHYVFKHKGVYNEEAAATLLA